MRRLVGRGSGLADLQHFRHVACGARPAFGEGSDPLWRSPRAYVHFAVIDYNASPAVPGLGSAIFIHADMGVPTSGCVSLPAARLVRLLRWLRPELAPIVEIRAGELTGR